MSHRVEVYKLKDTGAISALCAYANNIYNQLTYINRQLLFAEKDVLFGSALEHRLQQRNKAEPEHDNCKHLYAQNVQQIRKNVDSNWKSFLKSLKAYKKDKSKFKGLPKPPKYKEKGGLMPIVLTNQQAFVKDEFLVCSIKADKNSKTKTKLFKPIKLKSDWSKKKLCEARIVPLGKNTYRLELVYKIPDKELKPKNNRIIGVDLGLNNFLAVSSTGSFKPVLFSGKGLKSRNIYFNYQVSKAQSELQKVNKKYSSKRIQHLWRKRSNVFKDYFHKVSRILTDLAVVNDIDTVVVGHNKGQKQKLKGFKNFKQIPHTQFIEILDYKLKDAGIELVAVEESYTSGTSAIDNELPTKKFYNNSRRIYRGLFRSNTGKLVNADVNAATQIVRKYYLKQLEQSPIFDERLLITSPVRLKV